MGSVTASIVLALLASRGPQGAGDISPAAARAAVESAAATIAREYFDEAVASRAALALRDAARIGRYDDDRTIAALAAHITGQLLTLTRDQHLAVAATAPRTAPTGDDESRADRVRRTNAGVQRVEIMAGNVGYLNLTALYRIDEARDAVAAAMRTLRNADALIVDMRENGGGSPETVALLASYLFDAPAMPLFEIVPRSGPAARYATDRAGVPDRNGTRPIFVLTGPRTFSAGEGFAFLLQDRKRATVVGERTAGAANPGRAYPIDDRLEITVPNGRLRVAVGGGNWEGTGVAPDIAAPAADALRVAHGRALAALAKTAPSGAWRDTLERVLRGTEGVPDFTGTWILANGAAPDGAARELVVEQTAETMHVTRRSPAGSRTETYDLVVSGGMVGGDGTRRSSQVRLTGNALVLETSECRRTSAGADACVERSETWSLGTVRWAGGTAALTIAVTTRTGDQVAAALLVYRKK